MSDNGHHETSMKLIEYRGYKPYVTDEQARAAFIAQYGYEPKRVIRNSGAVLVGPIQEGHNDEMA